MEYLRVELIVAVTVAAILLLFVAPAWLISKHLSKLDHFFTFDDANPWQRYWGESYGKDLKERLLQPLFENLEKEDKIGHLIVDVGSGALPVTQLLKAKPERKRICVDVAGDNVASPHKLTVRLDADNVGRPGTLSFRKALVRVCAFLGINPRTETDTERADTIVFSDVLNYVDFFWVLGGFANYLKPEGRFIVFNWFLRGNRSLFSIKGLKNNRHLYAFLAEHHFQIEHKSFPKRRPRESDETEELIVLVARKCSPG